MIINQNKLNRQLGRQEKWMQSGCSATLEACTGFGKTYEAILIIQRLHRKYPDAQVDVVVPGRDLKDDWTKEGGHIEEHQLINVNVYVVNTYVMNLHLPVLLILDEVHHYASEEFGRVFQVSGCVPLIERRKGSPYILALTATLERIDGKHSFIEKYCPIVDTVTLEEARREGYVSQFTTFNWGLRFNKEDQKEYEKQDSIFKNAFGKFNHNFDLAMTCSLGAKMVKTVKVPVIKFAPDGTSYIVQEEQTREVGQWRLWWSRYNNWDGEKDSFWSPSNVTKYAQQFTASMRARKSLIYKASVKIDAIQKLFEKFPVKTMIFSEDSIFANAVEERFGKEICRAYHTYIESETVRQELFTKKGTIEYKDKKLGKDKTKERIKHLFKTQDNPKILATVKALNEGFDFEGVRLAVMASYNSSKRDDTQRTGRAVRLDINDAAKKAIVVNLYIMESQEEKWLREKQKGKQGIIWVESIDEINLDSQVSIKLAD